MAEEPGVIRLLEHRSPTGSRRLRPQPQKTQPGLGQQHPAERQRSVHDNGREHIGEQTSAQDQRRRRTQRPRRLNERFLFDRQRVTTDQASEARDKALEAIKELPDDVREAVRSALQHLTDQSYPRRLLDLADHVGQAVPGVTGVTQQWKKRVTASRVGFAHALEHGFLDEDNVEEAMTVLQSLRWLLTGLLLLQTGIGPATLGRLLGAYEGYQTFLEQARVWLPAVYETPAEPAQ